MLIEVVVEVVFTGVPGALGEIADLNAVASEGSLLPIALTATTLKSYT
jgi:hypothetical protein